MAELKSNRDLYIAIEKFKEKQKSNQRSLEEYLRALLQAGKEFVEHDALSIDTFHSLLADSFTGKLHEFDEEWRKEYENLPLDLSSYYGWRAVLIQQIVDLREMDEHGTLADKYKFFGVDSPRGSRWYNFEPTGYLECAMAGSLGGWEPRDDSDRQFVPGKVATLTKDGMFEGMEPQDIPRPQFELSAISWEQFKDFLYCGQLYE